MDAAFERRVRRPPPTPLKAITEKAITETWVHNAVSGANYYPAMSTPAPAAGDKPFDPKDFPKDLLAAQLKLAQLYAALHTHQAGLSWSREANDGWPEEPERWHRRGRPETTGWESADAETYDRLWEDLREAAAAVQGHEHWKLCKEHGVAGADLVAARQALKHAEGAVPATKQEEPALDQDDVERAA